MVTSPFFNLYLYLPHWASIPFIRLFLYLDNLLVQWALVQWTRTSLTPLSLYRCYKTLIRYLTNGTHEINRLSYDQPKLCLYLVRLDLCLYHSKQLEETVHSLFRPVIAPSDQIDQIDWPSMKERDAKLIRIVKEISRRKPSFVEFQDAPNGLAYLHTLSYRQGLLKQESRIRPSLKDVSSQLICLYDLLIGHSDSEKRDYTLLGFQNQDPTSDFRAMGKNILCSETSFTS